MVDGTAFLIHESCALPSSSPILAPLKSQVLVHNYLKVHLVLTTLSPAESQNNLSLLQFLEESQCFLSTVATRFHEIFLVGESNIY
jgi:hypothetical protein